MNPKANNPARAQALIEFALLLPLLLIFAFFILDFGRAVYYKTSLYNAAREGARFGISNIYLKTCSGGGLNTTPGGNVDQIKQAARDKIFGIPPMNVNVEIWLHDIDNNEIVLTDCDENEDNQYIKVRTSYCFKAVTPFVAQLTGSGCFNLTSQARMRVETKLPP